MGLAREGQKQQHIVAEQAQSRTWPPEMFHYVPGLNPESSEYTNAVDIWALGCITYRILTGKAPFPDLWSLQRYCRNPKLPIFLIGLSKVELAAENFVRWLMSPQPGDHLTASTALEHPWLSTNTQTAAIAISQINQICTHPVLAGNTPKALSIDARAPSAVMNNNQSQYNYNMLVTTAFEQEK